MGIRVIAEVRGSVAEVLNMVLERGFQGRFKISGTSAGHLSTSRVECDLIDLGRIVEWAIKESMFDAGRGGWPAGTLLYYVQKENDGEEETRDRQWPQHPAVADA